MEIATVREAVSLSLNTKAISPYALGQVLNSYSTIEHVKKLISEASIGGGGEIDLSDYAKKSELPTKLGQLTNDVDYIQAINGLIPSRYLPSYVDDILEFQSKSDFPKPGEAGKIYVDLSSNLTYRWGSSDYIEISKSLALGTTSTTAYRGDHGLVAYNHVSATGNPHGLNLGDLGILIDSDTINYLEGLDENILVKLGTKLNLSGGTLTGRLILHADPADKMHAVTKQYVDNMIDGVSVTVTQNVTRISEIIDTQDAFSKTLGAQAETITQVENEITGLNQTTTDHTTILTTVTQNMDSLSEEVSKTSTTVTTLEATINLLDVKLPFNAVTIPVDKDAKPINTTTVNLPYEVYFKGTKISTDYTVTINGTNTGLTLSDTGTELVLSLSNSTAILKEQNIFEVTWSYTQSVEYTFKAIVTVTTVPKGEDGRQGIDGKATYVHIKYGVGKEVDGETVIEFTAAQTDPSDQSIILVPAGDTPGPYIGQYTSEDITPSTNVDDYTWYKFTEDIDDQLNELIDTTNKNTISIGSVKGDIEKAIGESEASIKEDLKNNYATITSVTETKESIQKIQDEQSLRINAVEQTLVDGVKKVDTGTGFKFDTNGLTIEELDGDGNLKTGEGVTRTVVDTKGMTVYSLEAAQAVAVLKVTSREVVMPKAKVESGIQIGTSWSLEEFIDDELGICIGFFNM